MNSTPGLRGTRLSPYWATSRRYERKVESRRRHVWSRFACLKSHALLVLFCVALMYLADPAYVLMIGGVAVGLGYATIAIMEGRREPLWMTPLTFFLGFFSLQFGPASIYVGYELLSQDSVSFSIHNVASGDVAYGYLISVVALFCMHVGMEALRPASKQVHVSAKEFRPQHLLALSLLWCIGLVSTVRASAFGSFGIYSGMLQFGALAATLTLALVPAGAFGLTRRQFYAVFSIGVVGHVLSNLNGNSKSQMMFAFVPVIVLIARRRSGRRWLPFVAGVGVFLYLLVVAPLVNGARESHRTAFRQLKVMVADPLGASNATSTGELLSSQFDDAMTRMCEYPPVVGFLVSEVRRSGFQMGATMDGWYYGLVPRILWAEKPVVSRGAWFTTYIGLAPRPSEATSSTGITAPGEWYWNFGWPGVIGGMFLTGAFLGGLWRLCGSYPVANRADMFLYVIIMMDTIRMADAISPLIGYIALYLAFISISLFRYVRRERTGQREFHPAIQLRGR